MSMQSGYSERGPELGNERVRISAWTVRVTLALAVLSGATVALIAVGKYMESEALARTGGLALTLGQWFTFFFVTLGPMKVIAPFYELASEESPDTRRELALRGTAIAAFALLIASTFGAKLVEKWGLSEGTLLLTGGLVLFWVAMQQVLTLYTPTMSRPVVTSASDEPPLMAKAFTPLAFPTIITPYGVVAVILAISARSSGGFLLQIVGVLSGVLTLDLLAMLGAEKLVSKPSAALLLRIVGAVLGIMQVALGIQFVVAGLRLLRVVL